MARTSRIVGTASWPWLVAAAVAACSSGGSDYPVVQPPVVDAAVDAARDVDADAANDAATDARLDALPDAAPDASPTGADLAIAITAAPEPVAANATLGYTIDVTNHGMLDARTVAVTQRLPPGNVAFQSASGIGWTCNSSGQLVTCTRTTLLVGAAPSIEVKVTTPAVGGALTTTAQVTADTPDPDPSNNDASSTVPVLTPADLAIAISDGPDPVAAGGTLSYAITVTNTGPGASTAVTVTDSLPSGVAFVSASGAGWSCSAASQDVTCVAARLDALAAQAISLIVTAPTSGGTVTNTAQVTAMTPDGNQANNAATAGTTVNAAADLSIAMIDTPDPVLGSGVLQYTITVDNLGPNTASGITVTDALPAGNVAFVSATGSGWTCLSSGQVVTCTRPALLVGTAPTIAITVRAPSEATNLGNTATVTSTSSDLDPANNSAVVITPVLSAADLSIAVIDAPDPVTTTGALTYSVTASNAGPSAATGVTVTSVLPTGAAFVSATGINWDCSALGQQVTCSTSQLALGAAPVITLTATAPGVDGSIVETSSITSTTADPVPGNNAASQTTVVNAPSDLSLALSVSPGPVPARSTLTYTIAITDLGPRDATNLVVTNRLPDGNVLFLGATGIGWTCALAGQIVTCTRPLLLVGAAPSIAIQIRTPDANVTLIDEATVTAATTDLDGANNAASNTTNVIDSADLSIAATETPVPVRIGTDLTYTLSVANNGPSSATAVSVVDLLPDDTTFIGADGAGWACSHAGQIVTCTISSLGASSSAPSIAIVATAPATAGNILNTATVSSLTSDPDGTNNTAATTTLANAFADLSVVVGDDRDPVQGTAQPGCNNNDCVDYTIDVTNDGPDPATGITVVTQLPRNGAFFNAVGIGWICPAPGATLTCTRTGLDLGATSTITLTWKAPSPGGFSIVVASTVSGTSTDPAPANNTASQDTTVKP